MQIQQYLPLLVALYFIAASTFFVKYSKSSEIATKNRDGYIDGLRGIAAIAVVATHFWRIGESGTGFSFEFFNRDAYGSLGVQIFFCITGFLFFSKIYGSDRSIDWNKFYAARFRRIVPAYVAFLIFSVFVLFVVGNWAAFKSSQIYNITNMAYMGFKGNGRGVLALGMELDRIFAAIWTLAFEVRFYLAFPFVAWILSTKVGGKLLIPLGAAMIWFEISSTGSCIAGYFLVGALSAKYLRPIECTPALRVAGYFVTIATLYLSLTMKLEPFGWERFIISSAMFFALVISKPQVLASRPLTTLGDISYSMYLMHAPLLILLSPAVKLAMGTSAPSIAQYMSVVAVAVVAMFFVSLYSYKHVELPFLRKNIASSQAETQQGLTPST
ncbi:TPA: acyltransferase [Pseudomonas aeruginosa]|nr:acyltransferase [Pseudomonas aeruginosa]